MYSDLHCRLRIDCNLSIESLQDLFDVYLDKSSFGGEVSVRRPYKNDLFDRKRFNEERRMVFAKFTAEFEPIERDSIDQEKYIGAICDIIVKLRKQDMLVSAACEFEDAVAKVTGWNWRSDSRQQPIQP